jgi:asparagine synthase (glutamine-hydrolysing)
MTALAGVWHFDGRPDAAQDFARMLAAQRRYGPDSIGQWSDGGVTLGRRLMRLLPEDAYDSQPLIGGAGRYVLVADVRLDNRDELIDLLQIPAADALTRSDAAILLAAIERWHESCFKHLIGDYAFALWDTTLRRLLLARDPLGQRPLHYHRGNGFFAFASMPKGLHALPDVPYKPDEQRIAEALVLMPDTGTRSFFYGIERVEPGHVAAVSASGLTTWRHWQPDGRRIVFGRTEDYGEALRELLDQAVRCRLRGVRTVAAELSGGFDSGAVAATAARLLGSAGGRVIAFTVVPRNGYDGPARRNRILDETPYAAATAALYPNMEHVLVRIEERSPLDSLDNAFYLFDRPKSGFTFGLPNSIYDAVRDRKLTVLLNGNAGNIGLSYDGLHLLPELARRGCWLRLFREGRALVGRGGMRWRGVLALTLGPWCPAALWIWLNHVAGRGLTTFDRDNYSAVNPRRFIEANLAAIAKARNLDLAYRPRKDSVSSRLWALRRIDGGNFGKGLLAGWHIDRRDPTADVRLLEYCLAVPTEQFLHNGTQRALARHALADRLPKIVLDERRRGLQGADWHEMLSAARDPIAAELDRLDGCAAATKALDLPRLHRLVENWPTDGWERPEVYGAYRLALVRGIAAGHFLRRASGSNN